MIVLDAGVWVRALVEDGPAGEACRGILVDDPDWLAPGHAPIEVLRTIRRYEALGRLTTRQADRHARSVREAEVRYAGPERWLLAAVWEHRHNVSPYDAPYVTLALRHDLALVTLDERLGRAARTLGTRVLVPGSSMR